MNSTPHTQRRALRRIVGWGALFLFVGAASPLGLGLAALAGALDRSHHLSVQGSQVGLQLVLQHGGCCATHHHGAVARVLTLFAHPASATNPDHILQFSASDHFSRQVQFRVATPETLAQPDRAPNERLLPAPCQASLLSIPTHPPPDPDGQLRCRGSTLWLI